MNHRWEYSAVWRRRTGLTDCTETSSIFYYFDTLQLSTFEPFLVYLAGFAIALLRGKTKSKLIYRITPYTSRFYFEGLGF